ncbi:phage antirepressor KilAC domain-containing protein [Bacillus sp. B-jedd]|uniref:phage antirepressor KilAC domain-containing protein n=1 Tax=Bacillus sp. B-jedd TaxID=1476857 RepID=UPI0005156B46|nr:phage antirepressor KilAC domain-containing protein [Bacillus sp. B-jedd]CEG28115.1 phage anti-repressor protein [Bacillus sp. B-jedd]
MQELITTTQSDNGEIIVSARELYDFLGVPTPYTMWFDRMADYGFTENQDFITKMLESTGGRPKQDHLIKLDMAKEIAMLQRSEKGKQARQYFIQLEKMWNSPEMIMKRALEFADKQVKALQVQLTEQKPKVLFAEALETSKSSILIGELAKLLKQNGIPIGQNRLFQWLRENSFLIRKHGESYNLPTQYAMDLKLFEIKKRTINNPDGSSRTTRTPKVTGKGQIYFINKFLEQKKA